MFGSGNSRLGALEDHIYLDGFLWFFFSILCFGYFRGGGWNTGEGNSPRGKWPGIDTGVRYKYINTLLTIGRYRINDILDVYDHISSSHIVSHAVIICHLTFHSHHQIHSPNQIIPGRRLSISTSWCASVIKCTFLPVSWSCRCRLHIMNYPELLRRVQFIILQSFNDWISERISMGVLQNTIGLGKLGWTGWTIYTK